MTADTAARLGLQGDPGVLVSLTPGADPGRVAARIAQTAGLTPTPIKPPAPRRAALTGPDARRAFEPYRYIDHRDGTITIDPAWVRRNITRAAMPVLNREVACHRLMIPQLRGALQEIADRGLTQLIDPAQYGGCFVARRIDWNPTKPLSTHSWGLAIDLNTAANPLGAPPAMDPRIVAVFKHWGFTWGGDWPRPDGMHFQLGALIPEGQ